MNLKRLFKVSTFLLLLVLIGCSKENDLENGTIVENIFEGWVTLESQYDVDKFGENNYTKITGDLTINRTTQQSNINNLDCLNKVSSIGTYGFITIVNCHNLKSLCGIQSIILNEMISKDQYTYTVYSNAYNSSYEHI